jgi:hypothetical protein
MHHCGLFQFFKTMNIPKHGNGRPVALDLFIDSSLSNLEEF